MNPSAPRPPLPPSPMMARINATWPKFESVSGWRMHSEHSALAPDLRAELDELYRPQVARLETLLGRNFSALWGPEAPTPVPAAHGRLVAIDPTYRGRHHRHRARHP
jgi:hypothetical protein